METVPESDSEEHSRGEEVMKTQDEDLEPTLAPTSVSVPEQLLCSNTDAECPDSYRLNSPDETRMLAMADNFHQQYSYFYPNRKPLLLSPVNECGVKKFVSTTIRPTTTSFPELYTWNGCASFVANFLSLDLLEPPTELPRHLFSSTSVLRSQRASCFEFATLLCSLLLGANYDAYCVSGYAARELCLDESLQDCLLLDTEDESLISQTQQVEIKYTVKPPKELKSNFLIRQKEAETELLKLKLQKEERQQPPDPLHGLRVHCWVLVLSGSRSIQENFFINPPTGNSYRTSDAGFLGIESMWNNLNYYVNMQACSKGCADVSFDVEDLTMWEPVLFGAASKKQLILDVVKKKEKMLRDINKKYEEEEDEEPPVFEMPRSWVSCIKITKKDMETRWPGGQKVMHFKKAKLEKFSQSLRVDGLVARLTTYNDIDCTEVIKVKEWYQYRKDYLDQRERTEIQGLTTDRFKQGEHFSILVHRYKDSEFMHVLEFSSANVDNLVRRVVSSREMTETFKGRPDLLYYRRIFLNEDMPVLFQSKDSFTEHIEMVVDRFHRDASKPPNEDVAERVLLIADRQIEVTYHLEKNELIPAQRTFKKPKPSTELKRGEDFRPTMVSSFKNPASPLRLYEMMQAQIKAEKLSLFQANASIKQVKDILERRKQEEADTELLFSPWMTTAAARARKQREEQKRLEMEKQRWQEEEQNILAPYLIQHHMPMTLRKFDAGEIYRKCLKDYHKKLEDEANLIQERCDKVTLELQKEQEWYQKNQLNISREQEQEYQQRCAEKLQEIHVAKKRLTMHKDEVPERVRLLQFKLLKHPSLAPHAYHLAGLDFPSQPQKEYKEHLLRCRLDTYLHYKDLDIKRQKEFWDGILGDSESPKMPSEDFLLDSSFD